ncbi:MAG: hypothetical protein RLZZ58_1844 [Pseudomonadota bacterium]|jgi:hypothetical protein
MMRTLLSLFLILSLAACSRTDNEPGEGGVTVAEAKALDAAAEKLEARDAAAETAPGSTSSGEEE